MAPTGTAASPRSPSRPSAFDVAVVITDGNPTFYGAGEGPGNRTRFREVENGIFSANAVKAEGTRVIAFGVGDGVDSAGSGLNLRSISGPTLNSDYYQTDDYAAGRRPAARRWRWATAPARSP